MQFFIVSLWLSLNSWYLKKMKIFLKRYCNCFTYFKLLKKKLNCLILLQIFVQSDIYLLMLNLNIIQTILLILLCNWVKIIIIKYVSVENIKKVLKILITFFRLLYKIVINVNTLLQKLLCKYVGSNNRYLRGEMYVYLNIFFYLNVLQFEFFVSNLLMTLSCSN